MKTQTKALTAKAVSKKKSFNHIVPVAKKQICEELNPSDIVVD